MFAFYCMNPRKIGVLPLSQSLLKLALTGCLGFLLTLYAGFLVMLSLAKLGENTTFCALSFESAERTVKRFIILDLNFCHLFPLPPLVTKRFFIPHHIIPQKEASCQENSEKYYKQIVNFAKYQRNPVFQASDASELPNNQVDQLIRHSDFLDDRLAFDLLCKAFIGLDGSNGVFLG